MNDPWESQGPTVNLHIEELIIEGIDERDGIIVGAALRSELTRLIAERGVPSAWRIGEIGGPGGPEYRSGSDMNPESTGRTIARSIYGGSSAE